MKKITLLVILISNISNAQNMSQLKPMLKQIALLKTYTAYLEKGYDIAGKGLNTISVIKNGHLKLDIEFYNSLKNVNPKIKNYLKVAAIADYRLSIANVCKTLKKQDFNKDETVYINSVIIHLLDDGQSLTDLLSMIITDQTLQMSDDERIKNIDSIYEEVKDQFSFIRNFSNEACRLILQRAKEKNNIDVCQKLRRL